MRTTKSGNPRRGQMYRGVGSQGLCFCCIKIEDISEMSHTTFQSVINKSIGYEQDSQLWVSAQDP